MSRLDLALAAGALALGLAGAAIAQDTGGSSAPTDTSASAPPPPVSNQDNSAPEAQATGTTTMPSGATDTNVRVTNGPVPDTAENRAKYGSPMSHAGKRTKPAGN